MDKILKQEINIGWNFDNSYIHLPKSLYKKQNPTPVANPELIILNKNLARSMGLNPKALEDREGVEILAGNRIPPGSTPIAQAYAGHQFGYFTMLGDGRAILLGEHLTPDGKRLDIQLKGGGRTPYSRGGDGRAALGPMLREYIISEALYNLNIPTTRSLAVITTGENIFREEALPGAILTRIGKSHIRVGTFQYVARYGNKEELELLAEYTLQRHFPDISGEEDRFLLLLRDVIKRQAELVAKWQLIGFIHGVMNTDNMTISGESIDFGPCAFMDIYNPDTVFSSIDARGRYAYGNQPKIAAWNLARFGETLLPLIHQDEDKAVEIVNNEIESFGRIYYGAWFQGMRKKLGIFNKEKEDKSMVSELLQIMFKYKADYTNTFRSLTLNLLDEIDFFKEKEFINWINRWKSRLERQEESIEESKALMKNNNPAVIPRNHRVEETLEAAYKGNYCPLENLLNVLSNPYEYNQEQEEYSITPPTPLTPYRTFCGT